MADSRLRQAGRLVGGAMIAGGRLAGRGVRWVFVNSTIDTGGGPRRVGDVVDRFKATGKLDTGGRWEPIDDMQAGESMSEYLRRKRNADVGANYGPHHDLTEQAYVKDRHGNLQPYRPRE